MGKTFELQFFQQLLSKSALETALTDDIGCYKLVESNSCQEQMCGDVQISRMRKGVPICLHIAASTNLSCRVSFAHSPAVGQNS